MPRHLLLVEDEDAIREVAVVALERVGGWRVTAAADGQLALGLARTDPPDAILLDVMMPGLDGPATLAALRREAVLAGVPVIFLTAKVQATERRRLIGLGAAGVIAKPFDPMELSREITNLLGFGP